MNRKLYLQTGILFSLMMLLVASSFAQQLSSEVTLFDSRSFDLRSDKVVVQFALTNDTEEALYFLKYQTPIAGVDRDLFLVSCDGEPVQYIGPVALRLGPAAEDWVRLAPGETISANVDLSRYYDMRRSGTYAVQYRSFQDAVYAETKDALPVVRKEEARSLDDLRSVLPSDPEMVESKFISFNVEGACEDNGTCGDTPDAATLFEGGQRGYCSSSQYSILMSSQSSGQSMAAQASSYLYSSGGNSSFYNTWFGAYDSSRYWAVTDKMSNIESACGSGISYSCGGSYCSGNVIAYVYPSYAYYIYICDGYWGMGSSDQAAVIVHEASHWSVVAGTYDYTYGYYNCQSLASSYPEYAIRNADNYRYAAQYAP